MSEHKGSESQDAFDVKTAHEEAVRDLRGCAAAVGCFGEELGHAVPLGAEELMDMLCKKLYQLADTFTESQKLL